MVPDAAALHAADIPLVELTHIEATAVELMKFTVALVSAAHHSDRASLTIVRDLYFEAGHLGLTPARVLVSYLGYPSDPELRIALHGLRCLQALAVAVSDVRGPLINLAAAACSSEEVRCSFTAFLLLNLNTGDRCGGASPLPL